MIDHMLFMSLIVLGCYLLGRYHERFNQYAKIQYRRQSLKERRGA